MLSRSLDAIYTSFDPFAPPNPAAYVDCQSVRGSWDVIRELGRKIVRSQTPTCQLYTGHRGVGKSTELLRLKDYLEQNQFCVVYFAADEQDIEPQDAEYADILLACTRHLVETIQLRTHNPLLAWMRDQWKSLQEIALTEISFEDLSLEAQISQFAKITANLRAVPDMRRQVREQINPNTVSLVKALNEFIAEARKSLSNTYRGIVVIVDNLDRIATTTEPDGRSNHEDIYLNRSAQLRGLDCHVIYTVPISLVYSRHATQLEDFYDKPDVLPMLTIQDRNDRPSLQGIATLKEIITRRIALVDPDLAAALDSQVFDSPETLDYLCAMTGGHVRILMQAMQKTIDWIDELPIPRRAVQAALSSARSTYEDAIQADEWLPLATVFQTKQLKNDEMHRYFLRQRCVLEYCQRDEQGNSQRWYNVHPLIQHIDQFQQTLQALPAGGPP